MFDEDGRPYTQSDHDEAAEVGGTVLWLFAVALMVAAIIVTCECI